MPASIARLPRGRTGQYAAFVVVVVDLDLVAAVSAPAPTGRHKSRPDCGRRKLPAPDSRRRPFGRARIGRFRRAPSAAAGGRRKWPPSAAAVASGAPGCGGGGGVGGASSASSGARIAWGR